MKFDDFEQARLKYVQKRKKVMAISLPIIAVVAVVALVAFLLQNNIVPSSLHFISKPLVIVPIFFIVLFGVIVYFVIITIATGKELAAYKEAYKTYFVAKSFANVFTNIKYNHLAAMPEMNVQQVMTTGDRYTSNDYMTATYKNINFAQADVHTERRETRTDSNGHTETYYVTIFRGRFFIFDFNRNFDFALQVRSKSFPGAVMPSNANTKMKFNKLETESAEFNKDFRVYGQDGVDTFYILDPAFIEKIHNLYHALDSALAITFVDGKIYIAVNSHKDAFEAPNPKQPVDEKTEIEKVSKDIKAITNFVDDLDLDHYNFRRKA